MIDINIIVTALAGLVGAMSGSFLTSRGDSNRQRQLILTDLYSEFISASYSHILLRETSSYANLCLSADKLRLMCDESVIPIIDRILLNTENSEAHAKAINELRELGRKDVMGKR